MKTSLDVDEYTRLPLARRAEMDAWLKAEGLMDACLFRLDLEGEGLRGGRYAYRDGRPFVGDDGEIVREQVWVRTRTPPPFLAWV